MAKKKLTPMMVQYRAIKEKHQDKVLFFRLGDFYEMFDEDAKEVSRLLNLTLTRRGEFPMCGIPYHAAKTYIRRLLEEGKKIAICEQTDLSGKLATREVVRVITPATVVDDDFLDAAVSSYLFSLYRKGGVYYTAYADITTGEFCLSECSTSAGLFALLQQVSPKEILVLDDDLFTDRALKARLEGTGAMITPMSAYSFKVNQGYKSMCAQLQVANLTAFGLKKNDPVLGSGGALLEYLNDTARSSLSQITGYRKIDTSGYLRIDESSRKNLELVTNSHDGTSRYTLFKAIDRTVTGGGTRLLKKWLSFPLKETDRILERQSKVTWFYENQKECEEVRTLLKETLDLERLSSRLSMKTQTPATLIGIQRSVEVFFSLLERETHYQSLISDIPSESFACLLEGIERIAGAIKESVTGPFVEGAVIKDGYDEALDEKRSLKKNSSTILKEYLNRVKEECGITTMKLSSNKVVGHYLEVPKTQAAKVPDSFYRKQTLVNAERFTSDELIELEGKILHCVSQAESREFELYNRIVEQTRELVPLLLKIAKFLNTMDLLSSLAVSARTLNYTAPSFTDDGTLTIESGRHPVVEQQLKSGEFISNPLTVDQNRFFLVTGPNMAGKSTYLRQNALIVLLAQIGSYVPAQKAVITPVDRIFCRVGAGDNLARGESTFLVEMEEAAMILHSATERSLVIVDELGRGTSSIDGMAIAWAVMKELVEMRAVTLFATHYHELAEFDMPGMGKLTLTVAERDKKIIFLRKVEEGVAKSSYGLNVARLAGIPFSVIREATQFQNRYAAQFKPNDQIPLFAPAEPSQEQKSELKVYDKMRDLIAGFDINTSTPIESMALVLKLKELLS